MLNCKVVFITENHAFGGGNKYVEDLINSFSLVFSETHLICNEDALQFFNSSRLKKPLTNIHPIKIYNLAEKIRQLPRLLRAILRILISPFVILANLISLLLLRNTISRLSPDVIVLANGGYPASLYLTFYAAFFCPNSTPCIMSVVGTPVRNNTPFTNKFWHFVDSRVGQNLKYLIVNAENIKSLLTTKFAIPADKIEIIRNGLSITPKNSFDHSKDKPITIGFLSRIEKDKGIYETLEAFRSLSKNHASVQLVIVGTGSELENVKKMTMNENRISVLGYIEDVTSLYSRFDIYVLPSYHEGLPYSLIEACRASCAIVATSVGGIPEVLKDGVTGLLIQPQSTEALLLALEKLVSSKALRDSCGAAARKNFEENMTLDSMDNKVLKLVASLK